MTPLQKFRALLDEYAGRGRVLFFKRFVWGQKAKNLCYRQVLQTRSRDVILTSWKDGVTKSYLGYPKAKHVVEHAPRVFFVLNDIMPGEVLVYDFSA